MGAVALALGVFAGLGWLFYFTELGIHRLTKKALAATERSLAASKNLVAADNKVIDCQTRLIELLKDKPHSDSRRPSEGDGS